MNWSIHSANAHSDLKIAAIAPPAAMTLVWGSLAAHMSTTPCADASPYSVTVSPMLDCIPIPSERELQDHTVVWFTVLAMVLTALLPFVI